MPQNDLQNLTLKKPKTQIQSVFLIVELVDLRLRMP